MQHASVVKQQLHFRIFFVLTWKHTPRLHYSWWSDSWIFYSSSEPADWRDDGKLFKAIERVFNLTSFVFLCKKKKYIYWFSCLWSNIWCRLGKRILEPLKPHQRWYCLLQFIVSCLTWCVWAVYISICVRLPYQVFTVSCIHIHFW